MFENAAANWRAGIYAELLDKMLIQKHSAKVSGLVHPELGPRE
jgi:hypothetical protein